MKKRLTVGGALLIAFFFLGYGALHSVARSESFRSRIQSTLSEKTGYDVRIDRIRLTPWLAWVASGVFVSRNEQVLFAGRRVVCFFLPLDLLYGRIHRLSLENPVFRLSLEDVFKNGGKTSPKLAIGGLNIEDGEFVLQTGYGAPIALRAIFLSARNVNLGGQTGLKLRAYLPGLNGHAAVEISGGPEEKQMEIRLDQRVDKPAAGLSRKPLQEKTVLQGRFRLGINEKSNYEVRGSATASEFRLGQEEINGQLSSVIEIDPKIENALLSLNLSAAHFPIKLLFPEFSLPPSPVTATLRGRYSASQREFTFQEVRLTSDLGMVEGGGRFALANKPPALAATIRVRNVALDSLKSIVPKALDRFSYSGKIAADLDVTGSAGDPVVTGTVWSDRIKLEGGELMVSDLSLKLPIRWTRSSFHAKAARVQGRDVTWGRKGAVQWKVAEAILAGDAIKEGLEPLQAGADFSVKGARFSNREGSKVGENLAAKGRLSYHDRNGEASFAGNAQIERLELLWNKFFGDFAQEKPSVEFEGSYQRKANRLNIGRSLISLASIGRLGIRGSVDHILAGPAFNLDIRTDDLRHAGFYDFFVRDTFKMTYPILGQIGMAGKTRMDARVQGTIDAFAVRGRLRVEQSEIRERSGRWRVGPMTLDLPLEIRFPEAAKVTGESPLLGTLLVQEVKTASTAVPEVRAGLSLWNNSLRFPKPIRISLFGGTCVVEDLAWKDVIAAPKDVSFSLKLDGLRLADLTQSFGWHRFGGTLSGSIPKVHWAGDSLRSDGVITLDVFGGQITIQGMTVEKPFLPVRAIGMNARLENLDLAQASETFEFGRISGVLAGSIEGLVISHGQPAQFKADIRSVDRPGVSQWISVEALNKITVLSSGNEAGFIYGGIAGLFESFRYSKLGFKAALKNDKLLLRGIESKEGKEYLVVGSFLPPTVNIISHTQEIGFSELLRRLERIQKTGSSKSSEISRGGTHG
ncbi:MAG: hypothetical protein HY695_13320 [Deltaproteobacteria bacterium]|nr:hypothetical protein [Deltaproteobacteria bacterium]